ncbi:MAG: PAS domain S-box protein [Waterburya sp.]
MQQNYFFALEQLIDRQPLTVPSKTPLTKVIRLMQEWGNSCNFSEAKTSDNDPTVYSNNSCVLIVENSQLRGIFTERDLVRLIADGTDTESATVDEVMTQNVVTITPTNSQDIFTVVAILRQHSIRHLPVMDERHNLLGLITAKNLRQKLQPINLMKWRKVKEIMETEVIYAAPNDSIRHLARLMAIHHISYVAIGESKLDPDSNSSFIRPIGIITERDIVQFQNLNLDLEQPAQNLMSTPLFLINPEDTLWSVKQQMQQRRVRRLLVGDAKEKLLGIVTQTSLLQIFEPTEMYGVIEVLQRQVCQLEVEKTQLLEHRQAELEHEVQEQTNKMQVALRNRQQAEIELRESQERYALAVEGSSNGLWDWNILTDEVFYAPWFKTMIGYNDAEMPNTFEAWSSKLHSEDRARVLAAVQDHLENRIPFDIEYRLRTKQGEYLWFQARGQAIWDQNGQAVRMAGSITDIGDRKRREEILKDIALGVTIPIGANFLSSLVQYLSKALQVDYAFVGEITQPTADSVKTLAVYGKGQTIDNFTYQLANAPGGDVVNEGLWVYAKEVRELFPKMSLLEDMEAEGYAGMPILNNSGQALGLIAVVDSKPFTDISLIEEVLKIFATRATAELERQQAELSLRQSEQKFRAIFDQSFQFIGLLEPNGNIIEANKTALDFVGLTIADVRGEPFWKTPWWSMSVEIQELIRQAINQAAQGEFVRFEVEHPGTENRLVTVDFSLTPIKDETGQVVMLIPEGRNISKVKQTEANLDKSNQILQAISSIQSQFLTDAKPGIMFDAMLDRLLELTQSEYGFIGEILFAEDGSPIMKESCMKFRGRPFLKTHAITNIAWNESTRAFYAENAPRGMEFHNLQTLFGAVIVTGEPVIANSPSDDPRRGGLPDGHPPLNTFLGVPFYKNNQMTGMVGIANRDGGYDQEIVDYLRPLLDTYSRIVEAYKSDRQRHQVQEKNREQAALLDIANDAIMVRGLDNQLLFWNRGAERLYGWTQAEALEQNVNELLYQESIKELKQIQRAVKETGTWQGELNQITKAGHKLVVESRWTLVKDDAGNPQSYLVVNTDITEQKQLEAQFLRTQRLESLGTLAGGIAHDLNNILAPILGFARLLPLKLPDVDEQTKSFFKIMETNAQRGTALVKQILTFSRGLEGDRGIVQIRHLIVEIGQIIKETFPKTIELEINAPKNLWTVNADVNQLHQVLMNLAVNARDAMPDGGKLTIKAENFTVGADYARLHLDAKVGSYLLITVTDTGVGIPPEIIDRIFEPFFTTKEIGHGTGLGLSTAIGIIKSHDGFVEVISKKQNNGDTQGTQFQVFLPAGEIEASATAEEEAIPQGEGELVLVVDDETAILEVTKATLETYNYQVLTAGNGIEAIAVYAQNQQAIDLVIMDIMMPSMDGKMAILTLKQINPEIKIIAVSGLIDRQEIIDEVGDNISAYLAKPYANDDLLIQVNEIVSG